MKYEIDDRLMTRAEIDRYMERIGVSGEIRPDLKGLERLQIAHLMHIPYENMDSLQGLITSLNHEAMFEKMIIRHRGGICFELNGLYAWLLKSLGYEVKSHAARFTSSKEVVQMRRHRVMTVSFDGRRYLTDVGVNSESPRKPLLLIEGLHQSDDFGEYYFEKHAFLGWLLWQRLPGHQWKRLYGFTEEPQLDIDFVMPCIFCDIHPLSPLNKFEKISLYMADRNIRVWGNHYQEFKDGKKEIDNEISDIEKRSILREKFGIE